MSRLGLFPLAALALVGLALGAYTGIESLVAWTASGEVPGARDLGGPWPVALLGLGGVLLVAGLCRLAPASIEVCGSSSGRTERLALLAAAVVIWALGTTRICGLPPVPAASQLGMGPAMAPAYWVLTLALGLYALGFGPRLGLHLCERLLVVLTFLSAANGKLFSADPDIALALVCLVGFLAAGLLVTGSGSGPQLGRVLRRVGRVHLLLVLGMLAWWMVAAAAAYNTDAAWRLTWRLVGAAGIALVALAAIPEDRAGLVARRVYGGIVAGLGVTLVVSVFGLAEAAAAFPLSDVLATRARLLGGNPNLMAAYLAMGLPLALGWLLGGPPAAGKSGVALVRRLVGSFLVASLVTLLYLTRSRSGQLGAAVGGGLFLFTFGLPFGRRLLGKLTVRSFAAGFVLAGLLVAALVSPLGDGVRADLDAKAQTQSALGQRWHFWKMAAKAGQEHPWTGLGPANLIGHAQYAGPSYYDGTVQTWHAHNIFMAALEGAGWPGLLLFCCWLVAFFGLLARVAGAGGGGLGRAPAIALLSASLGLLACNLLDLGQSQLTMVPLFFWAALLLAGLGVPATPPEEAAERTLAGAGGAEGKRGLAVVALLLAAWFAAGSVLVGHGLADRLQRLSAAGEVDEALELGDAILSPWLAVDRFRLYGELAKLELRKGRPAERLELLVRGTEAQPLSAVAWQRYATALIAAGHFQRGAEAAERTFQLDPRGANAAKARTTQAWAALGLGQAERACELLIEGLAGGAKVPSGMPIELVSDPAGGPDLRLLVVGDERVSMTALLEQLGEDLVALAATDELTARRRIPGLVEGFRFVERPGTAAAYIERMIAVMATPIRSVHYALVELLFEAGDEDRARELWAASPFAHESTLEDLLGGGAEQADAELTGFGADLFYTAGVMDELYLAQALALVAEGQRAKAEQTLDQALFLASDLIVRARLSHEFLVKASGSADEKLRDLERYLAAASLSRANLTHGKRLEQAARVLLSVSGRDEQRARASLAGLRGDLGAARGALGEALDRVLADARPGS
ncbi:MAG: O-antigen ligase family protein [Planctomycetota bacterium]|nr:O-antigen ligase family protein [Planctomycetota bacterium]